MVKTVAIDVDYDLLQAVIRKYRLVSQKQAVQLALRWLLDSSDGERLSEEDEYDQFSDLEALRRRPRADTG